MKKPDQQTVGELDLKVDEYDILHMTRLGALTPLISFAPDRGNYGGNMKVKEARGMAACLIQWADWQDSKKGHTK